MESQLTVWLNDEIKRRGWSLREVARRGGDITAAAIINVANGTDKPGLKTCAAIARAFDMPQEKVMELAGILPGYGEVLPEVAGWSDRLRTLPEEKRQQALDLMERVLRIAEGHP